jgi:hypothetical protein
MNEYEKAMDVLEDCKSDSTEDFKLLVDNISKKKEEQKEYQSSKLYS